MQKVATVTLCLIAKLSATSTTCLYFKDSFQEQVFIFLTDWIGWRKEDEFVRELSELITESIVLSVII